MATKNDITGDSIKSKPASDAYRESPYWDNLKKEKEAENDQTNEESKDDCKSS